MLGFVDMATYGKRVGTMSSRWLSMLSQDSASKAFTIAAQSEAVERLTMSNSTSDKTKM